jgi:hypothetical protein
LDPAPLLLDFDNFAENINFDLLEASTLDLWPDNEVIPESDEFTTRTLPLMNSVNMEQTFQDAFSTISKPGATSTSATGEANHPAKLKALPSPYTNHIRLNRQCLYAACHRNVLQIGVPVHLAETPGCPSPFYQPYPSLESAFSNLQILKPDLQPTDIQRSIPHEIYIDTIPFPTWRDRVINLLSLSPPGLDERELKRDLDKDGLVCWGTLNGRGSGAPWDRRSWEAQKWFLDKWWFITKDTEVECQSAWWRMMRGEDEEDV